MSASFSAQVMEILNAFDQNVIDQMQKIISEEAKKGAADVSSASWGSRYPSSWTHKVTHRGHRYFEETIYSKRAWQPHLLENGHATRNGGRVPARMHILPVDEATAERVYQRLSQELGL